MGANERTPVPKATSLFDWAKTGVIASALEREPVVTSRAFLVLMKCIYEERENYHTTSESTAFGI